MRGTSDALGQGPRSARDLAETVPTRLLGAGGLFATNLRRAACWASTDDAPAHVAAMDDGGAVAANPTSVCVDISSNVIKAASASDVVFAERKEALKM